MQSKPRLLRALVLAAGLATLPVGVVQAQPRVAPQSLPPDQVGPLVDRMAQTLNNLREDIDVDLPDTRGRALLEQTDRTLEVIRHMQREVRRGESAEHMREHAADLIRELHSFIDMTAALGEDGRFLRRSAARLHDMDQQLLRMLGQAPPPPPVRIAEPPPPRVVEAPPPPPRRVVSREVWAYRAEGGGQWRHLRDDQWVLECRDGNFSAHETTRKGDYIELHDDDRNLYIHIYDTVIWWRRDNVEQWFEGVRGEWVR